MPFFVGIAIAALAGALFLRAIKEPGTTPSGQPVTTDWLTIALVVGGTYLVTKTLIERQAMK